MAELPVYRNKVVITTTMVDDEDIALLPDVQWNLNAATGYVVKSRRLGSGRGAPVETLLLHRVIMAAPAERVVDHINGNKLDNRRSNLRLCSNAENIRNQAPKQRSPKGVKFNKRAGRWMAAITINYKSVHLGYFDSPEAAASAYDAAAKDHFGEFARMNGGSA